jgi:hypothetical protein
MRRYPLLLVNVAALGLAACGTQVCGPTTCVGGCCTAMNECVSPTEQNCGKPGTACTQCAAGEQCTLGLCTKPPPDCTQPQAPRCDATAVPCQDQSIMQLRLYSTSNPDTNSEEGAAPTFKSVIDARAGGVSPTRGYQYLSFSPTGLQKKDLSDEQALASLDWEIAVRRYVLRLNSGVSGPGCTEAARTAPGTDFDSLSQVPAGLSWRTEVYFSDPPMCTFVPDTSGIGAPGTALSSFWTYQMCVQMTGNVYIVHLRDGRYVKLKVLSYYSPTEQATCDMTGSVPMPNSAGLMRVEWGFICAPPP